MMFEVSKATEFKEYLETLNTVTVEPIFKVNEDGLKVETMDPSHVALIIFELPCAYFDTWRVDEEKTFSVNLSDVLKAIKKLGKRESLRVELMEPNDSENERLVLTVLGEIERKKTIPCLEVIEEEIPTPRIHFKSKIRMTISSLKQIVEDFNGNQEYFKIVTEYNTDMVRFSNTGDAYQDEVTMDKHHDHILELNIQEDTTTSYSSHYLLQLIKKAYKICEVVTIDYSTDMPLRMDLEIPMGSIRFFLAPAIGV